MSEGVYVVRCWEFLVVLCVCVWFPWGFVLVVVEFAELGRGSKFPLLPSFCSSFLSTSYTLIITSFFLISLFLSPSLPPFLPSLSMQLTQLIYLFLLPPLSFSTSLLLSLSLSLLPSFSMDSGGGEWVEIIEPQSKEKMFANPLTGEILLQPPYGATV